MQTFNPGRRIKLMITGGHVTPAIAVIEEIRRQAFDWDIVFVGRPTSLEGTSIPSEEKRLVTRLNIRFLPLSTGRMPRFVSVESILSFVKIPFGFARAVIYCLREKPALILSFGGYVALPVVLAGWLLGIASVTHEQTRVAGFANRIIGAIAVKIFVSFAETADAFNSKKVVVTGLPIKKSLFKQQRKKPWAIDSTVPIVLITGGSTGAASINRLVFPIIAQLVEHYCVVHQTGRLDIPEAQKIKKSLSGNGLNRYVVTPYLDGDAYSWVLGQAAVVVGRSGANTVGELAALGKVSILIPLPWSGGGEQDANAEFLREAGSSILLHQEELTPEKLFSSITTVLEHRMQYEAAAKLLMGQFPTDAATKIVQQLRQYLDNA